jgi:hypothetical protein
MSVIGSIACLSQKKRAIEYPDIPENTKDTTEERAVQGSVGIEVCRVSG